MKKFISLFVVLTVFVLMAADPPGPIYHNRLTTVPDSGLPAALQPFTGTNSQATNAQHLLSNDLNTNQVLINPQVSTLIVQNGVISSPGGGPSSEQFGLNAIASTNFAQAFGFSARATSDRTLAFGIATLASATAATAVGYNAQATGPTSSAFGTGTFAVGQNSIAMGSGATALADGSISFGLNSATLSGATNSVAFGPGAIVSAPYTVQLGGTFAPYTLDLVLPGGSVHAVAFYGDGSHLVNMPNASNAVTAAVASNLVSGITVTNVTVSNSTFYGSFTGNGAGLTGLIASTTNAATATLATNLVTGALLTNVTASGTFSGNGAGLTNVTASTTNAATATLATNLVTGALLTNVTASGTFSGNGSGLTNLVANTTNAATATLATNLVTGAKLTNVIETGGTYNSGIFNGTFTGIGTGLTAGSANHLNSGDTTSNLLVNSLRAQSGFVVVDGNSSSPGSAASSEEWGANAHAGSPGATAIGNGTTANGNNSTVVGTQSYILGGTNSVTVGAFAQNAGANNAISIGGSTVALFDNTVQIGYGAQATALNQVIFGPQQSLVVNSNITANGKFIGSGAGLTLVPSAAIPGPITNTFYGDGSHLAGVQSVTSFASLATNVLAGAILTNVTEYTAGGVVSFTDTNKGYIVTSNQLNGSFVILDTNLNVVIRSNASGVMFSTNGSMAISGLYSGNAAGMTNTATDSTVYLKTNKTFVYRGTLYSYPSSTTACLQELQQQLAQVDPSKPNSIAVRLENAIYPFSSQVYLSNSIVIEGAGMEASVFMYVGPTNLWTYQQVTNVWDLTGANRRHAETVGLFNFVTNNVPGAGGQSRWGVSPTYRNFSVWAPTNFPCYLTTFQCGNLTLDHFGFFGPRVFSSGESGTMSPLAPVNITQQQMVIASFMSPFQQMTANDCWTQDMADGWDLFGNAYYTLSDNSFYDICDNTANGTNIYYPGSKLGVGYAFHIGTDFYTGTLSKSDTYNCRVAYYLDGCTAVKIRDAKDQVGGGGARKCTFAVDWQNAVDGGWESSLNDFSVPQFSGFVTNSASGYYVVNNGEAAYAPIYTEFVNNWGSTGFPGLMFDNPNGLATSVVIYDVMDPSQQPAVSLGNGGVEVLKGTFSGNGSGLANLNAGAIFTGTLAAARLPSVAVTNGMTNVALANFKTPTNTPAIGQQIIANSTSGDTSWGSPVGGTPSITITASTLVTSANFIGTPTDRAFILQWVNSSGTQMAASNYITINLSRALSTNPVVATFSQYGGNTAGSPTNWFAGGLTSPIIKYELMTTSNTIILNTATTAPGTGTNTIAITDVAF